MVKTNGKWGYVEKTGKMAIKVRFDFTWHFSEDLASVVDELYTANNRNTPAKWFYIDRNGKRNIPGKDREILQWAGDFAGGCAPIVRYGEWRYIDREENYIWNPPN